MNELSIFLIILGGLVIGIGLPIIGQRLLVHKDAEFAAQGVPLEAEVTNLREGRTPQVGYTYILEVPNRGRQRFANNAYVPAPSVRSLRVGGPIQIVYLPSHPDQSRPAPQYLDPALATRQYWGAVWPFSLTVLIVAGVWAASAAQSQARATRATDAVNASRNRIVGELRAAIESRLPLWRETASAIPIRLSATDAGFSAASNILEVIYGTCQARGETQFYVYALRVINTGNAGSARWLALGYAYLPDSATPAAHKVTCAPPDWTILTSKPLGNLWHEISLSYPAQMPFFVMTATAAAP